MDTAESYYALLKRGVNGIFLYVSRQHLGHYCDEYSFRWNYRNVNDTERTIISIRGSGEKADAIGLIKLRKRKK